MKYPVIFEENDDGTWGAYPPDLPGVGVTGATRELTRERIRAAIAMHIEALRSSGVEPPAPFTNSELVEVA